MNPKVVTIELWGKRFSFFVPGGKAPNGLPIFALTGLVAFLSIMAFSIVYGILALIYLVIGGL